MKTIEANLKDADSLTPGTLRVVVEINGDSICVRPEGYGDCGSADAYGCPVLLERHRGRLRLIVWPHINCEEPQIIDLEGARESERSPS